MHHILFIGEATLYHHALVAVLQKELEELQVSIALFPGETNDSEPPSYPLNSKVLMLFELQPHSTNPLEQLKKIHSYCPAAQRMVILENASSHYLKWCNSFGIKGFLQKHASLDEFIQAVKQMIHEGWYCSYQLLKSIATGNSSHHNLTLTTREMEILKLICEALNSEQIAKKLFLSKRTVEWHRTNLLSKTGCKNSAGLVAYAWQLQNPIARDYQSL